MVVSSPAPCKPLIETEALEPRSAPSSVSGPVANSEPNPTAGANPPSRPKPVSGPNCDLRSRGMGKFPPRLAREPRPKNGPHAHVHLPPLPSLRGPNKTKSSRPIPPLNTKVAVAERDEEVLTLEMRPARLHVSSLWHRLRFSGFSPMASQRRSTWKPGKPRRGRPEGTKGAGSRSI